MAAWFFFIVVVLGWGSTFLAIKVGLAGLTPAQMVSARNLLAAAGALLLALIRREAWPRREEWPRVALMGLLLIGAGNLLTALAQRSLSTGVAGLLNASISLWIVLLSSFHERVPRRAWAGAGIGLAGVALLLLPGDRLKVDLPGALLMLGATLSFSTGAMLQRRRPAQGGTFAILAIQMAATGLVAGLISPLWPGPGAGPMTGRVWAALAFLAAVPSLFAFAAFAELSRRWPPSRFGIYAVLTPVVAVGLGSLLLREPLTPRMISAMGIILGGVVLVQRR